MERPKKKQDLTSEFVDLLLDDPEVTKKTKVSEKLSEQKPAGKGTPSNTAVGTSLTSGIPQAPAKVKPKEGTAISPFRPSNEVSQMVDIERSSGGGTSFEENISKSEHLRLAQNKILELEDEIERLRVENEQFSASNQAMKAESEEMVAKIVQTERRTRDAQDSYNDEKNLLKASLTAKDKEILNLRSKVEELESRLLGDLKKIRVRERELENRLELAKMEGSAVLRTKDETILDLKRQVDQVVQEIENFKMKSQGLHHQIDANEDRVRRAVKALRLALSMLDGEEGVALPLKKAE